MEPGDRVWDDDASPAEEERYREIIRERVENSPFYQHMGLEVTGLGRGWATFKMPAGRHLWNAGGIVHGGAITSIADAATGVAIATLLEKHRERPVTIELKLNFCSPVVEGTIEARGQVVQKGSRIAVCEVEVTDGDRLVAKGISTYMITH
jgi:uncharacterized protein (TIGR00369 family)